MIDEILVSAGPRRRQIALLQGGRLLEFHLAEVGAALPERIVLGRVTAIRHDLNGAFVDIGEAKAALLSARDAPVKRGTKIGGAVQEGQSLLVQVRRQAEDEKGARLTGRPRLTGRGLVFQPLGSGVTLTNSIADATHRQRLREWANSTLERHGGGWILRTAAAVIPEDDLAGEAEALQQRWQGIQQQMSADSLPCLLDPGDDPLDVALREQGGPDLKRVSIDDGRLAEDLRRRWPDASPNIDWHQDRAPLFERYDLQAQIEVALQPHVDLPSGGRITIERTQALTAVDVDSAQHDGFGDQARLARDCNHEAANEIARQLRLRDIGGRVVVDFIPMQGKGQVADLLRAFEGWLAADPGQVRLGRMSELGLVELMRRRRHLPLSERLTAACGSCGGTGRQPTVRWAADNLLDYILREAHAAKGRALTVRAAAAVVADLGGADGDVVMRLAAEFGCRVQLQADTSLALQDFQVTTAA